MAFHEIVAPTVKALFIQQIEGMILSGELRPGDRLPTERELADEMKISKTVVHEGLRELHRLGFERCIMYLTGMGNIRDVVPFPRTVNNCEL